MKKSGVAFFAKKNEVNIRLIIRSLVLAESVASGLCRRFYSGLGDFLLQGKYLLLPAYFGQ